MLGDNERSGAYASEQRRLVRAAVAAEVLTFNAYWRESAAEAGLPSPRTVEDLQALPPRPLAELGPPDALVLRPSADAVRKLGPRPLRRRLRRVRLRRGRAAAARRVLDPLYTAVHWIIEEETPVGCTEADLLRLAEIGRRGLDLAGITPRDAIVGLVPPGPNLAAWQLTLGAREAGVPLAGLSPATSLAAVTMLGPTVLAGRPPDLLRVLQGLGQGDRSGITTILAVTRAPLSPDDRDTLGVAVGGQADVLSMWAPPGVRALWTQCRGGAGVHTWPQSELIQVRGPDGGPLAPGEEGELIWTGLGWRGTVFLRLATGVRGRLVEGGCGSCGRTTPRILDAQPMEGAEPSERPDALVGPIRSTNGIESVRTVRTSRKDKAAARAAAKEAVAADDAFRNEPVEGADAGAGAEVPLGAVPAVAKEELAGAVRAVPRDDIGDGAPTPAERVDLLPSEAGEVDHLPPVPGVGPDPSGDGAADQGVDPWLPDTGEVDAWPAPVLASVDGLAGWQVEHRRRRGHDELVVHLALADGAELGDVLVSLERSIGATQYVVGDEAGVAARVAAADGRRVVDRRARRNGDGTPSPTPPDRRPVRKR